MPNKSLLFPHPTTGKTSSLSMEQSYFIYDRLLELPLFQGHSREDLTTILTHIKVDFRSFRKGQTIVEQDQPCRNIIFLLDGEVALSRFSPHNELLFTEFFSAPNAFGMDTLFGLRQNFNHTIQANSDVRTLVISKQNVISQLFPYEVFRYNLINMLTTRLQRQERLIWASEDGDIKQRFVLLCKRNFIYHGGNKQIGGGMVQLAKMMDETRIHISNMLNDLEQRQLITLGRKKIVIPHLENLIQNA